MMVKIEKKSKRQTRKKDNRDTFQGPFTSSSSFRNSGQYQEYNLKEGRN